jgi:Rrf2 family protein
VKFSTRAGYGLRATVNLARNYPKQKSLQEISREEGISLKYLEQLFRTLKKNKLVVSQKGREGGYVLAKNPRMIKVGEIIEILEGPIVPMECASGKSDVYPSPSSNISSFKLKNNHNNVKKSGRCGAKCSCASSIVWTKLQTQIKKTLYSIKLKDLIK